MFSAKLTRAAHRAAAATASCPGTTTPASSTTTQCLASVSGRCTQAHQRRPSSSKASCPPDSTAGGKPAAPAAKAADTTADGRDSPVAPTQKSTRGRSRSSTSSFKKLHNQSVNKLLGEHVVHFDSLPSVPSIQNLNASDLGLSSFFSLHRPLSLASPLPPPSSKEAFETIFTSPAHDAWENGNSAERRPEDIIITLQHTIDSLEGSRQKEESEGIHWEVVIHPEGEVKHLDSVPKLKSLDELVAQFRPFRTPPPPVPFVQEATKAQRQIAKKARKTRQPRQRAAQSDTAIANTVTIEIIEPRTESEVRDPTHQRQTFLERMHRRRKAYLSDKLPSSRPQMSYAMLRRSPAAIRPVRIPGRVGGMYLISVKRQRKLKMKKHKYKKLMKRTRNLRRRQDRI